MGPVCQSEAGHEALSTLCRIPRYPEPEYPLVSVDPAHPCRHAVDQTRQVSLVDFTRLMHLTSVVDVRLFSHQSATCDAEFGVNDSDPTASTE